MRVGHRVTVSCPGARRQPISRYAVGRMSCRGRDLAPLWPGRSALHSVEGPDPTTRRSPMTTTDLLDQTPRTRRVPSGSTSRPPAPRPSVPWSPGSSSPCCRVSSSSCAPVLAPDRRRGRGRRVGRRRRARRDGGPAGARAHHPPGARGVDRPGPARGAGLPARPARRCHDGCRWALVALHAVVTAVVLAAGHRSRR